MLLTWVIMMVDKAFFRENGVEYACAPGKDDICLFATYREACHEIDIRTETYRDLRYRLTNSGNGEDGDDLLFWQRLERDDGWAHVLEIRKKNVYGDVFQVGRS